MKSKPYIIFQLVGLVILFCSSEESDIAPEVSIATLEINNIWNFAATTGGLINSPENEIIFQKGIWEYVE